jgi:glycopeptide antibiotics resistance protein
MKKLIKIVFRISFILYIFVIISVLFLRPRGYVDDMTFIEYVKNSINIFPFKTISTYVKALYNGNMNIDIPLKNLGGNLILFLPMGIYLPLLTKKVNDIKSYSIFMVSLLFSVEVMQLITRRGSFDIDDFILNMLGAFLGFAIWKTKLVQKLLN